MIKNIKEYNIIRTYNNLISIDELLKRIIYLHMSDNAITQQYKGCSSKEVTNNVR